ncbi:MAG: malonyl-CoA O-methyltransferase [Mariniblastus sp.]|jgi:malonyl-CoA O-methyltransferase
MKLVKEQIARQFSRAAATYDQAATLQFEMALRLIQSLTPLAGGTVVDLGCGTGGTLEQLAGQTIVSESIELIGIDLAPGMIELAQQRVPRATFHCCDLESTPLGNASVAAVVSNAAIQWCDTAAALNEIDRICQPGASIRLSTFGPETMHEVRSAWLEANDPAERVHVFESAKRLEQRITHMRWLDLSIISELKVQPFDSVDALLKNIKQVGATNASLSRPAGLLGPARYRKFRNVLEQRLARDGQLNLTYDCIYAFAKTREDAP